MRDGQGNKLSQEEEQDVRSIQGAPDRDSVIRISIDPKGGKVTGYTDKPKVKPSEKPTTGPGK